MMLLAHTPFFNDLEFFTTGESRNCDTASARAFIGELEIE